MTDNEHEAEIGRAYIERRKLNHKVECLRLRLSTLAHALQSVSAHVEQELRPEEAEVLERRPDVYRDVEDLRVALDRLNELRRVLD